jgi:2-methylisocitrate lyase-like PEP mutase family enzyme
MAADVRRRFRELHEAGLFVMPNPWDVGSARILQSLGFPALATTSSGHAASIGLLDQHVARETMLSHAAAIVGAVDVPVNVDSERCFGEDLDAVVETVELISETGAAGCSIEDYDPVTETIDALDVAAERVAAAAGAARSHGLVLTARAENHLYGVDDLDDTIARLLAYRDAGAEVVYAPGMVELDQIGRVVLEVGVPVNVLAWPGGPSARELALAGARRVSTGGALARAAYGALVRGANELIETGTSHYAQGAITDDELHAAFGD